VAVRRYLADRVDLEEIRLMILPCNSQPRMPSTGISTSGTSVMNDAYGVAVTVILHQTSGMRWYPSCRSGWHPGEREADEEAHHCAQNDDDDPAEETNIKHLDDTCSETDQAGKPAQEPVDQTQADRGCDRQEQVPRILRSKALRACYGSSALRQTAPAGRPKVLARLHGSGHCDRRHPVLRPYRNLRGCRVHKASVQESILSGSAGGAFGARSRAWTQAGPGLLERHMEAHGQLDDFAVRRFQQGRLDADGVFFGKGCLNHHPNRVNELMCPARLAVRGCQQRRFLRRSLIETGGKHGCPEPGCALQAHGDQQRHDAAYGQRTEVFGLDFQGAIAGQRLRADGFHVWQLDAQGLSGREGVGHRMEQLPFGSCGGLTVIDMDQENLMILRVSCCRYRTFDSSAGQGYHCCHDVISLGFVLRIWF
jgi:hypothetical protein